MGLTKVNVIKKQTLQTFISYTFRLGVLDILSDISKRHKVDKKTSVLRGTLVRSFWWELTTRCLVADSPRLPEDNVRRRKRILRLHQRRIFGS